jgi:dienelactone hydrolase
MCAHSTYSCEAGPALAGANRALDDLDAALDWLLQQPEVDSTRVVVGGTSRGGILSIAHLARHPDIYRGAINFVGGWLGEGCGDYQSVNRQLFSLGAGYPAYSLWLYAEHDSFYSVEHCRANFDVFGAAGGLGRLQVFDRGAGLNGHYLINSPELWSGAVADYLDSL